MEYLLGQRTRDELMRLLAEQAQGEPRAGRSHGGDRLVMVRCDSITAVGGNAILSECYPGTILQPRPDKAMPPETNYGCLLTVLGASGASVVPTLNTVYECLLAGEVESDGPGSQSGRKRAFSVPVGVSGDITSGVYKGAALSITSTNVFQTGTGSIVLPEAGTYLITFEGSGQVETDVSGSSDWGYLFAQLYDVTNAAAIGGTTFLVGQANSHNIPFSCGFSRTFVIAVASGITLGFQGLRRLGAAYLASSIGVLSEDCTIAYVKLTNTPGGAGPAGPAGANGTNGTNFAPEDVQSQMPHSIFGA